MLEKADVTRNDPAVRLVIGPTRIKASALGLPPAAVVSQAIWQNRYSSVTFEAAIRVEADDVVATVVESAAVVVPIIVPAVNSTAPVPSALALCQSRMRMRPAWLEAFVTAKTETAEYHVPSENWPVVIPEMRQQSSAFPKP